MSDIGIPVATLRQMATGQLLRIVHTILTILAEQVEANPPVRVRNPFGSRLPSRLKSLCRTVNGAKAPSSLVHTGTGPARLQVGWLSCLVFAFFFLSSVVWTHWSTFFFKLSCHLLFGPLFPF